MKALEAQSASQPKTSELPGYGTPEFEATRNFILDRKAGTTVTGYAAAEDYLDSVAQSYSADAPVSRDRRAVIVIGAPGAGKSSAAEPLARTLRAAIIDADDAKKIIPEFGDGIGAAAVHDESSELAARVYGRLAARGDNMILPKVGDNAERIRQFADDLRAEGYRVSLLHYDVDPDTAYRRMVRRALDTNRVIGSDYAKAVDGKPRENYYILSGEDRFDETAQLDGNQPRGTEPFLAGAGTELARAIQLGRRLDPILREARSGGRGAEKGAESRGPAGAAASEISPGTGAYFTPTEDSYVAAALGNLAKTSRTAQGVIDTSASAGKAAKITEGLSGSDAAQLANRNVERALREAYRARNDLPSDAEGIATFIDHIAETVNAGIVKHGELMRTDDSEKYPYTRIASLDLAHRDFFSRMLTREPHETIITAARSPPSGLADAHEADAETPAPEQANALGD